MAKPVFYGGQAVIEGVMMRGPGHIAVAVRREDGRIETTVRPVQSWVAAHPGWNRPFIRGMFALFDAMRFGVWGLRWSASRAMLDTAPEGADSSPEPASGAPAEPLGDSAVKGTMGVGLLFGVALFILLPTLLAQLARSHANNLGLNLIEGGIRLALFFGYVWGIGFIPGIRRVFEYHGAEHRTINAWEDKATLTPEACRRYSVIHPRCGTSFILFVLILSTIVYAFLGWHSALVRMAIRLALLPVIAGAAYELLRVSGMLRGNVVMGVVTWPGRFTQRFTTRTPDDGQTEVAIAALNAVLEAEGTPELA